MDRLLKGPVTVPQQDGNIIAIAVCDSEVLLAVSVKIAHCDRQRRGPGRVGHRCIEGTGPVENGSVEKDRDIGAAVGAGHEIDHAVPVYVSERQGRGPYVRSKGLAHRRLKSPVAVAEKDRSRVIVHVRRHKVDLSVTVEVTRCRSFRPLAYRVVDPRQKSTVADTDKHGNLSAAVSTGNGKVLVSVSVEIPRARGILKSTDGVVGSRAEGSVSAA